MARTLAACSFALSAVLAPLFMGASGEWTRLALEAVVAVACLSWAASAKGQTRSMLAAMLVAGVAVLQMVPLTDSLLLSIAPVSAGSWKLAHEGLRAAWGRISIDPAATAVAGRRLLLAAATIAAVADLARTPGFRRLFVRAAALACAAIWTLGIAFPVSTKGRFLLGFIDLKGKIQWYKTTLNAPVQTAGWAYLDWVTVGQERYQADGALIGDGFGPYIYSNHFAGAMSLTLPALIAVWLAFTAGRIPTVARIGVPLSLFSAGLWTVGPMAGSRAGTLSLVAAGLTMAWLLARPGWPRKTLGWLALSYGAGILAIVAVLLFPVAGIEQMLPDSIRPSIAKALNDARVLAAHIGFRMFRASPFLGTGLGSYDDLFPHVARSESMLYFAHNDYVQLLAEGGIVAGAIAAAFAAALVRQLRRFAGLAPGPDQLLGAAAWAATAGIGVHSAFDWNLHLPANAFLACLMTGVALSSGSWAAASPARRADMPGTIGSRAVKVVFLITILVSLGFLTRDARSDHAARTLRAAITEARLAAVDPKRPAPTAQLDAAIAEGERTMAFDRANPTLSLLIGQACLHRASFLQGDESRGYRETADRWFRRASTQRAISRGLPEPAPRK